MHQVVVWCVIICKSAFSCKSLQKRGSDLQDVAKNQGLAYRGAGRGSVLRSGFGFNGLGNLDFCHSVYHILAFSSYLSDWGEFWGGPYFVKSYFRYALMNRRWVVIYVMIMLFIYCGADCHSAGECLAETLFHPSFISLRLLPPSFGSVFCHHLLAQSFSSIFRIKIFNQNL